MGGDREFYSDSKNGFLNWKTEKTVIPSGESSRCSAEVNIKFPGKYYLQFLCDYRLNYGLEEVRNRHVFLCRVSQQKFEFIPEI